MANPMIPKHTLQRTQEILAEKFQFPGIYVLVYCKLCNGTVANFYTCMIHKQRVTYYAQFYKKCIKNGPGSEFK